MLLVNFVFNTTWSKSWCEKPTVYISMRGPHEVVESKISSRGVCIPNGKWQLSNKAHKITIKTHGRRAEAERRFRAPSIYMMTQILVGYQACLQPKRRVCVCLLFVCSLFSTINHDIFGGYPFLWHRLVTYQPTAGTSLLSENCDLRVVWVRGVVRIYIFIAKLYLSESVTYFLISFAVWSSCNFWQQCLLYSKITLLARLFVDNIIYLVALFSSTGKHFPPSYLSH